MADPRRVEAIFEAALDAPREELAALLEAQCGDDLELRQDIEELLALDREGSVGMLASPLFALAQTVPDRPGDPLAPAVPKLVGRFAVLEKVGEGGMGVVYAAYDEELDRKVAVKLVHPGLGRSAQLRMLREAQAMARVSHPNVMPIYEVGELHGQIFLAMEFVPGMSLGEWLRAEPRSWERILDMFIAIGRGLAAAHDAGVVHRDFKPDNVMVGPDGRPRVTDFGLARSVGEAAADDDGEVDPGDGHTIPLEIPLTRPGTIMGTPRFMSPEQILGTAVDTRSDQFSYSVALYHALYGSWPFEGEDLNALREAMLAGKLREPKRRDDMPEALLGMLRRGLAAEPAQRYPHLTELVDAIEDAHRRRHADPSRGRRARIAAALAMLGLFVLSIVSFEEIRRGFRTPREALPPAMMAFVGASAIALVMRRRLRETPLNRSMIWLLVIGSGSVLVNRTVGMLTGAAIVTTLAADQLLHGMLFVLAGVFVQRGLWWAALLAAVTLTGTLCFPAYATLWMGTNLFGTLLVVLMLWRRRPDAALSSAERVRRS